MSGLPRGNNQPYTVLPRNPFDNDNMETALKEFVGALTDRNSTDTSYNPYLLESNRNNLCHYLMTVFAQPGRRFMLVGEALGYRGGRLTGIPFSSERLLRQKTHPFLRSLGEHLELTGDSSEATATLVWGALANRRRIPLFWNAFPFHPHQPGDPGSNRAPHAAEIAEGQVYLQRLVSLYRPVRIAGLGGHGYRAVTRALPDTPIAQIRHPSYGGKHDFRQGLARLLRA